jgi:hypothetical protein
LQQADPGITRNLLNSLARERLGNLRAEPRITVTVDPRNRSTDIRIEATLPTILLDNIKGKQPIVVQARARAFGGASPLCLVSLDDSSYIALDLGAQTRIIASGCTIHSNSMHPQGFAVASKAEVTAAVLCGAGRVHVTAEATAKAQVRNDCPPLKDPLRTRSLPEPASCIRNGGKLSGTLMPGTYCGAFRIATGDKVSLQPGVFVFHNAELRIDAGATLEGTHVNMHFTGVGPGQGKAALTAINAHKDSTIDLTAPRAGEMAGLLITTERDQPQSRQFYIHSENARRLLGTIYLPSGDLWLGNGKPIADQSAFTIIVARKIATRAGPDLTNDAQVTLVLNTNYHMTDVPVPRGVGNNTAVIQLVK